MSGSNLDASRIEKMEAEIVDLKKLLLKIQTFSMETNLTLMKVKERQQIYSKQDKSSIVDTDIKDEVKTEIDSMAATDDAVNIVSSEETNDSVGITFSRTEKLNV
jgi:chromosome segregation and condensation protein ScpB